MYNILKKAARFIAAYIATSVLILGVFYYYSSRIEPNWIDVQEQTLSVMNLPSAFEGFKIVQISDLHGKLYQDKELVYRVRELAPDVVVITGDVFDEDANVPLDYADTVLGGLTAKYGVYFVFGNNDKYLGKKDVLKKLTSLNIRPLVDQVEKIDLGHSSIDLIGIDYGDYGRYDLAKVLKGSSSKSKILISHRPEIIGEASKAGVDLVLAGHTHGGQINMPVIAQVLPHLNKDYKKYVAGLYRLGDTQIYVNRGLGVSDLPYRFMVRPEITVITLHKKAGS